MEGSALNERRQGQRFQLQWTASLLYGSKTIECRVRDISNAGLCCVSSEPVNRGARLHCRIAVPPDSAGTLNPVYLFCEVQVVEVETGLQKGYGLHCRFEDYRLVSS